MIETSILIPAKNEVLNIRRCLDGVFSQSRGKFEVVLVDSGSTDGTVESVARYPVRLYQIPPEQFHHARTRNYLAGLAKGEFLVFLNADACPATSDWLRALMENFKDSQVGAVYGRQIPKPDCNLERQYVLANLYGEHKIVKEASRKKELGYRYYHMSTVNAATRRCIWETSPFPEDLKISEDLGFAKKVLDSGWKIVYDPTASVFHSDNHTSGGLFRRYFDLGVTWKKLGMWEDTSRNSLLRDGLKVLRHKITSKTGSSNGASKRSISIMQDCTKYLGLMLGRNEHLLPLALKRRMTAVNIFD
jgi:glycosyltransferase involved in cell wall biosynthesis